MRSASSPVSTTSCTGASRARNIDDVRLVAQPALDLGQQLAGATPKARAMRARLPVDVADQLLPLRPDRAEQHGLGIAFEDRRDVGEIGQARAGLELVGRQALDEAAQAETIEIRRRRGRRCCGPFRRCPCGDVSWGDVSAAFGTMDYSGRRRSDHKRWPRPIGNDVRPAVMPGLDPGIHREKSR